MDKSAVPPAREKRPNIQGPLDDSDFYARLWMNYERSREYTLRRSEASESEERHINPFWEGMIARRAKIRGFNDALNFLQSGAAVGLGVYSGIEASVEERMYADLIDYTLDRIPESFVRSFSQPPFGNPRVHRARGIFGTISYWQNLIGTYRIYQFVESSERLRGRALRVLEIGAGWGAVASQLMNCLPIESYTICDLVPNLEISSFYLQCVFPDWSIEFVESAPVSLRPRHIHFASPEMLKNLSGEFDVIINQQSFQEMFVEDVRSYMEFARERISPEGFVYSENGLTTNAQGRGMRASDYAYTEGFSVEALGPGLRHFPHMFSGTKHEIVLRPLPGGTKPYENDPLDALCHLIQARLSAETETLRDRYVAGTLEAEDRAYLGRVKAFFDETDPARKTAIGRDLAEAEPKSVGHFLLGMLQLTRGRYREAEAALREANRMGLAGLARVNAALWIALIARERGGAREEAISTTKSEAPDLVSMAEGILESNMPLLTVSSQASHVIYSTFRPTAVPLWVKLRAAPRVVADRLTARRGIRSPRALYFR